MRICYRDMNEDTSASQNPYAAPQAPTELAPGLNESHGPRWEQPGPVIVRFFQTIGDLLSGGSSLFFQQMRREGGWLAPLGFSLMATLLFGFVATLVENLLELRKGDSDWQTILIVQVVFMLAIPVVAALQLVLLSTVIHAILCVLHSACYPLETTFRVVAYASGCAAPLVIFPGNSGSVINVIVTLTLIAIGLREAQQTSTAKAAVATGLPLLLCIGGVVLVIWQLDALGMLDRLKELLEE